MGSRGTRRADYVYRNRGDTKRFRIRRWGVGYEWTVDVVERSPRRFWSFHDQGEKFATKREAAAWIYQNFGRVVSIDLDGMEEGWDGQVGSVGA